MSFVDLSDSICQRRNNFYAAKWRISQKQRESNSSSPFRRSRKRDLSEKVRGEMMHEMEKKFVSAEGFNQVMNDLEKNFISSVGLLEVMKMVNSRLDKLEEVQDRLMGKLEMMADAMVEKFDRIKLEMDEKTTIRWENCATMVDEKVTACFDECSDQFVQQAQENYGVMEKTLAAKLDNAMMKMEYNLMVRFLGETMDFDEFQNLHECGHEQVQRKKHKQRR